MRLCHVPTYQPIGLELQLTNDNLGPNRAFVRRHVHLHKQHMVEHENGKKIFAIPQKSNKTGGKYINILRKNFFSQVQYI